MGFRIVQRDSPLQLGERRLEVARVEGHTAQRVVRREKWHGLPRRVRNGEELGRDVARRLKLPPDEIEAPEADQDRRQLRRVADLLAQLACARVGTRHLCLLYTSPSP